VLNGAQAYAKRIDAEVGGTLHIESPQDTVEQESKQSGGGIRAQVALGTAWNVSGNYNQSKASGHSRSVGSQSGLFAGEGGYHITADSVRLKGGTIASAADKDHNELTARSFSFEDIRNESSYSAQSMGIGAGYGGSLKGSNGFNQSAFGRASQTAGQNMNKGLNYSPTLPQHESGGSQGYTRSVLSEGKITIGGQATSARALGIQTDLQNAHRSAEAVPDLQNLLDKQQTIAQSTAAIHSAVGTYRGNRAKAAAEELEKQQAAYEGRLKEQNDGSYEQYAGKSDSERLAMRLGNAKYAQAYQEARSWGIGGSKSRALSAAETLITGALGGQGDLQLAANTLAPYAAAAIGKRFGHGEHKNEAAQAIGHFMLGAALAYANGADPLAGGSAAVAAERAAEYLAKQYDDGHTAIDPITGKFNPNLLPEHIKEEIKAQTGVVASVVGAAGGSLNGSGSGSTNGNGNALFNAQVGGVLGQNAVENNGFRETNPIEFDELINDKTGENAKNQIILVKSSIEGLGSFLELTEINHLKDTQEKIRVYLENKQGKELSDAETEFFAILYATNETLFPTNAIEFIPASKPIVKYLVKIKQAAKKLNRVDLIKQLNRELSKSVDKYVPPTALKPIPSLISKIGGPSTEEIAKAAAKLAEYRTKFKIRGGNLSYLEGIINGRSVNANKIWRSSSLDRVTNEPKIFTATEVKGKNGNAWLRHTDSEYRMLNDLAYKLGGKPGHVYHQVYGHLTIVSEYPYCTSCTHVIQQFQTMFPNLRLTLINGVKK